jgi:hypothetical protein
MKIDISPVKNNDLSGFEPGAKLRCPNTVVVLSRIDEHETGVKDCADRAGHGAWPRLCALDV